MTKPVKKVVLLHQQLLDPNAEDQIDTLVQVNSVRKALEQLDFYVFVEEFSLNNLDSLFSKIKLCSPEFVFNLVETEGKYLHLAPLFLEFYSIPYSGCSSESTYLTTNKVLAKLMLRQFNLPTANWFSLDSKVGEREMLNKKVIIKSIVEDASINIDDSSVSVFSSLEMMQTEIQNKNNKYNDKFFIEEYIDGREFNISIIGSSENPLVLPLAEMQFINFPEDKEKIISHSAKWDDSTFEYQNTLRTFDFETSDKSLLKKLEAISLKCWEIFGLNGYARIDFRVDKYNKPWILEINANPGISEDSGFVAAANKSGLSYTDMIKVIINNLRKLK